MKEYEFITEIFNNCSGNQMRDVEILEIETDDIVKYLRAYLKNDDVELVRSEPEKGVTVFDIDIEGLKQRFTFTEL